MQSYFSQPPKVVSYFGAVLVIDVTVNSVHLKWRTPNLTQHTILWATLIPVTVDSVHLKWRTPRLTHSLG